MARKYKLKTINQQLANYKIPHAKQLYYSRSSKYFPFGFEITQYLEGQNCEDLLANKHLSYFEFYSQVAKLLSQVHKITLPKFGSVNSKGKEVLDSYQKYIDYRINLVIKQTSALPKLDRVLINKAKKQIFLWLETIPFTQPVLIHGDPTPKNCLLDLSQNLVLIDWDDAKADIWLADFAWLTYFGTYSAGTISPKRQKIIRDAFINNYGDYNFHSPEIVHFENALHLLISLELLPYYYFDQQNKDAYHWVKNRIVDILSLNRKM